MGLRHKSIRLRILLLILVPLLSLLGVYAYATGTTVQQAIALLHGSQVNNVVPFTQLAADLSAGTVPNFAFITPNAEDDGHDCPTGGSTGCTMADRITAADNWVKDNINPLIQNPALANSVFIIVFDEALDTDTTNGGGKIPMIMAGSHVKTGFTSTTLYQHQSTLRLVMDLLRVSDHPGLSATAPTMVEFFQ